MTVYHTPRVEIHNSNHTYIASNAANSHVVTWPNPAILFVGLHIDPSIRTSPGEFRLSFNIYKDGKLINTHLWSGSNNQLPNWTDFWRSVSFTKGLYITNSETWGVFNYRPSLTIQIINPDGTGSGLSEFAVAPEDYYFMLTQFN
jgi:hypothetical protein